MDAANDLRGSGRLDVLIAHRPLALGPLQRAQVLATPRGRRSVIGRHGLIAFQLQALADDPSRVQDLADIRALVPLHRDRMDRRELRVDWERLERWDRYDELLTP